MVFRHKAPRAGNGPALVRRGNTAGRTSQERPWGLPVSAHGGVATLAKGWAIRGVPRLARNADRPTEYVNIILKEYNRGAELIGGLDSLLS